MVQTKNYDVEFNEFIMNMDKPVTAGTEKAYKSQYLIIRGNFQKPLNQVSNSDFIEYLNTATTKGGKEISTNTKKNLMNLMVMVKKQVNEKEYKELYALREKLREDVSTEIKEKHENLDTDSIIKYDELVQFLKLQTNTSYIINYILLYYCTRNRDLNLTIAEYSGEIPDTANWLLIDKDKVIFLRNDYKTYNTYGQLIFNITNKTFIQFVKKLYKKGDTKLLKSISLDKEIRGYTMKSLSETEICKIVIHHFLTSNRYSEVLEISKRRASSLDALLQNYNFHYKEIQKDLKED
jgi:hypothetical protein